MVKWSIFLVCLTIVTWMIIELVFQPRLINYHSKLPPSSLHDDKTKPLVKEVVIPPLKPSENSQHEITQKQFKRTVYELWSATDTLDFQSRSNEIQLLLSPADKLVGPFLPSDVVSAQRVSLETLLFPDQNLMMDSSFSYRYLSSKDERHGIHLGVKESGVSVSTDIRTDLDKGIEVQYLEIEVDLPK